MNYVFNAKLSLNNVYFAEQHNNIITAFTMKAEISSVNMSPNPATAFSSQYFKCLQTS